MANEALEKLAVDLPQLFLQYQMKMQELSSQEAHELQMLQTKIAHETNIKEENKKLKELDVLFQTAYNSVQTDRKISEQNIINLQEQIRKSENQIKGIAGDLPKLNKDKITADAKKLPETISQLMVGPKRVALESEYKELNKHLDIETNLRKTLRDLDDSLTKLSSLELHTKQVSRDLGNKGSKDLLQSDDFEVYFDNVLTMQYDSAGNIVPDDELPGNSQRFDPNDPSIAYYKEVFVGEFSPSTEEQYKDYTTNIQIQNIQLQNYRVETEKANTMFVSMKNSINSSLYPLKKSGQKLILDVASGFDDTSASYQKAKEYLKGKGIKEDNIDETLRSILNKQAVTQAETFVEGILPRSGDSDKTSENKKLVLGLYNALGAGDQILELSGQVGTAQTYTQDIGIGAVKAGFYTPKSTGDISDEARQALQNIFNE